MRRPPKSLIAVAVVHQLAFWAVVLSNNPQATVTFDCVSGAMGGDILSGFAYSPFDTYDGILGGMGIAAFFGTPLFAVLGLSGFSVKLAAGLWSLMTVVIGWTFLDRLFDRRAAILGGLSLALPMPTMFLASTILGNWHYTELAFELAVAGALSWFVWRDSGPRRWGALLFGVLSGVALFNCFGSLIFFGAFWLIAWALLRARWGWTGIGLYTLGTVLGATPLWLKLLAHSPYGIEVRGDGGTKVPSELVAMTIDLVKLRELVVDNGFSWGLHFQDVLGHPPGTVASMTLASGVTLGLFAGWIVLMLRVAPSIGRLLRAATPGPGVDPAEISPAVVPALMGAFYGLAWFLSDMNVAVIPWYLSNVRELGHATLIPWSMVMGLSAVVLVTSLWAERDRGVPPGELALPTPALGVAVLGLGWVLIANGIGIVGAISDGWQPGLRSVFRGECHDVHGFYMGPHITGAASGAELPAESIPAVAEEHCAAYGAEAVAECARGVAWSVGFAQLDFEEGGAPLQNTCTRLPRRWRMECLRGLGWALQSMGEGGLDAGVSETELCAHFRSPDDRAGCWRGVGFPLGDHLHNQPTRLMRALQDFPPQARPEIARGAATHVGRTYSAWSWMTAMCQSWEAPYREACVAGLEDSMAYRSDAEAVRAR